MDPAVHTVLRLLLAALLGLALAAKLRGYRHFREAVGRYEVVPAGLAGVASGVVVVWEVAAVAGLLAWPRGGAVLAAALFALYAVAVSVNLLRGRTRIDCGCEWGGREAIASAAWLTPWLPLRNAILMLAALAVCTPMAERPQTLADYGVISAATPALVAAFLVMDRAVRQWLALRPALAATGRAADV